MRNALVVEFIGTFFLCFIAVMASAHAGAAAPAAIGLGLVALVYMGGHVSGAHYNPAVTTGLLVAGAVAPGMALAYIVAQVVGAVAGGFVAMVLGGKALIIAAGANVTVPHAFGVEALFTFMLALVVLCVAVHPKVKGNSFYGAAIGLTILAAAWAGGPVSGGAFNPAIGISSIVMDALNAEVAVGYSWVYLAGPVAGGLVAGVAYRIIAGDRDAAP